jgi:hypothetical protein
MILAVCIAVISVGCTVAVQWRKARQTEVECALKKEMVERGMSADDILKVLAGSSTPPDTGHVATELAEQGMSADDIVKVLKAACSSGNVQDSHV